MAALFPSSSSTPKHPRLSNVFDPTLQCVAFHQKQKKKAARIKATKVTVMLVNSNANSVPRGKHRKALLDNKSIEKLEVYRTMSSADVRDAILGAFGHRNLKHFVYLCVDPTHRFTLDSVQDKDGNCIADAGGKATVYIKESMHVCKLNYHPTGVKSLWLYTGNACLF